MIFNKTVCRKKLLFTTEIQTYDLPTHRPSISAVDRWPNLTASVLSLPSGPLKWPWYPDGPSPSSRYTATLRVLKARQERAGVHNFTFNPALSGLSECFLLGPLLPANVFFSPFYPQCVIYWLKFSYRGYAEIEEVIDLFQSDFVSFQMNVNPQFILISCSLTRAAKPLESPRIEPGMAG